MAFNLKEDDFFLSISVGLVSFFSSFVKKETFRGQKDFIGDLKLD